MFIPNSILLLGGLIFSQSCLAAPSGQYSAQIHSECEKKTANPLTGCPSNTIYVSQTDERAQFTSIQEAILSMPNNTVPYTILIAPGNYVEQLNVTRYGPLTLLGVTDGGDRSPYANLNPNSNQTKVNAVNVTWNSANFNAIFSDNTFTSTLTVAPNLNASLVGAGPDGFIVPDDTPFGNIDFKAYNIDFNNNYRPFSDGPAMAVAVSRANASFYSCGFYSWQDTVYIGKLGNTYFYDSVVAGQTDFLYGFGTFYIEKSLLSLRSCGGGITAWKGTNTTFDNKYGVYISSSTVKAANDSIAPKITGRCALGRPWNSQHRSIFMNTYMDPSILPAGYIMWQSTDPRISNQTFMATYDDFGPGYNKTAEIAGNITLVLDTSEVLPYRRPVDVFQTPDGKFGEIGWIDQRYLVPY